MKKNKNKIFNLNIEDKNNMIEYLINSKYKTNPQLMINLELEYSLDINNETNYIINENELMLMINTIYSMSKELKKE